MKKSHSAYRKKFLKCIAGKTIILSNTEISVKETHRTEETFEIHICFNSIDFLKHRMRKEEFLAALDGCLIGEEYNMAYYI